MVLSLKDIVNWLYDSNPDDLINLNWKRNYITWGDIRRCPFKIGTSEYEKWSEEDYNRLREIAKSRGWKEV